MLNKLKPTIVLTLICAVVAALLFGTNLLTKDTIAGRLAFEAEQAKRDVLKEGDSFPAVALPEDAGSIKEAYRAENGAGYVFKASVTGYSSGLVIMIGINADGEISGTKITETSETWGVEYELAQKYPGKDEGESFTPIMPTGKATSKTADGFNKAIRDAFAVYNELIENEGGMTDEE